MALAFDPYSVLGVPSDATRAQISQARRRLSRQYHPDVNSDPDAVARFAEIQRAFELLADPAARAAYDRTRTARGREAAPGIFVTPEAVDFKVLRSGQPGTDAEITVSWTGQVPARITSGTADDWWTTLQAAMSDPACVVFSLRAQARAGMSDGDKRGQFTVTLDDATIAVPLTARVNGVPPPAPAPVFPPAPGRAPVPVRRRKSGGAGPAILALITLSFTVIWALAAQTARTRPGTSPRSATARSATSRTTCIRQPTTRASTPVPPAPGGSSGSRFKTRSASR